MIPSLFFVPIYLFFIVKVQSHSFNNLNAHLYYNNTDGRLRMRSNTEKTLSIYWDEVAQDIVSLSKAGPTVATVGYVIMHSSIYNASNEFRATYGYGKRILKCSTRGMAMNFAAAYAIGHVFPGYEQIANDSLSNLVSKCMMNRDFKAAKDIGRKIANYTYHKYNSLAVSEDIDLYGFNSSIEIWKPEHIPIDNLSGPLQNYLTPKWGKRYTFGISDGTEISAPAPKSFLLVNGTVNMNKKTVLLRNGTEYPILDSLLGTVVNPEFVEQAKKIIEVSRNLTDKEKFIAEFWEAGGGTSFPPGMWLTIAQWISIRDKHTEDEDIRFFYILSNALSDAAVATWHTKLYYSYARPVRVIRDLAYLGIGIPRTIRAYNTLKSESEYMNATRFTTYQNPFGEPSPSFPEYTSGHSAFSASAAEVLRLWTGSDLFETSVSLRRKQSRFEYGRRPLNDVVLYWKTFSEAALQAGYSRIYGGIHFDDGNIYGIELGKQIGKKVYEKVMSPSNG